ncbi:glycosyl hydrolase family 95 catalytic domain-containing protein [Sphaerisporangium corydalis]|uniref:Discoidin domain-containing protein n=1 Tax=Sphaerisporangium corydalis TaxID=1441875 RepID=A0ABV9EQV2_9ACTN|nr:discoidin domain-containing protein [Sphaerisporangium corydalis]
MRHRRTLRILLGAMLSAVLAASMAVPSIAEARAALAARLIHVAKTGNDANAGTQAQPYRTINRAAQEAQPGDTVVVHAGLYRETVKPARGGTDETHRITYTNAGDGEVVVKGSEEINTWARHSGDVWKVTLPSTYFGDFNPYATGQPQGGEGGVFAGYTAGDVYLDEQAYYEKASLSNVQSAANTWYTEVSGGNTTIYANFAGADPNAKLAEINVRRQVFAPDVWGLGYITINGFTVKHAAGTYSDFPSSPTRRQAGAISVYGGLKWIIQNNIVVNARTIGIDIGLGNDEWAGNRPGQTRTNFHDTAKYGSHIVRNNYIAKSGQSGIAGVFSWNSDILYNMIEDTNYRGEFSGAETAPIKVHYMNEGLIKGNYIKNSKGGNSAGIWTDWGNQNVRITGNIVMNSPWGYYAEAVHGPILVDNNIFIGNSDIRTLDATGIVFANNLFLDNGRINIDGGGRDAYYFQPGTMNETTAPTSVQKFNWYNNLVQGSTLPENATNKTHVKEGNSTGVLSNVQVTSTNREMKLGFTLDASGIRGLTPVTKARVGIIPRANESIAADVTTDFFGSPINTGNVMAGPFAAAKGGANSFTLWPPAGQTVPTPPAPPADVPVNLSLNSQARATASYQDGTLTADKAIDGNASSRWSSDHSNDPNAWIQVDLGNRYSVSRVALSWETAYAKAYKVQVSDNAQQWSDVFSTTTGGGGVESVTIGRNARYVRMQGVTPNTQWGYSLYEFEVYGKPQPVTTAAVTTPAAAEAGTASVTALGTARTGVSSATALGTTKTAALAAAAAAPGTKAPSTTYPSTYTDWANGLLAGNGKQGIIVFGNPRAETVVFDDKDFFMARSEGRPHRTFNTVSQDNINRIRDLLIAGNYQQANQLAADVQGYQGGGEGSKHPGFKMTLTMPASGTVTNYVRSTDYSSGVVGVNWNDSKGAWRRDSFVSRTDGATVQYLPAPSGQRLDVKLGLSIDTGMNLLNKGVTYANNSNTTFLNLRAKYPNGSYNAGYEGVTRIVTDGTKTMSGTDVQVSNASYVLLLSLTQRYNGTYQGGVTAEQDWNKQLLQTRLAALPGDYQTLLNRHVAKHSEIFNRVSLDLGASTADRAKSNEELLAQQKSSSTPNPALMERMFYSGRYHLLASSNETAAPDLLGNWTGDSNVGWDGYYHLDANLNLQISGGNIGNMPEAMAGYFWLNKQWQTDFRTNAKKLLGTRGMLTGGNTPNGEGLISNINFDYPYQYVTGGESWLLYPFWEYYQITGDKTFLQNQYYPLIRDMGDFYQDFLVKKDANGKYIFAGSISPENRPPGGVPLTVNSVYDISGARFALSTLIETSKTLGKDADKISIWQELLDHLPPYLVNNDGALAEWAWPDLANKNQYQHRHASGLMPVWPYRQVTPEKNKQLYDAAKVFLQKKDGGSYENAGHGLLHGALIAADLNDAASVTAKLLRFAKEDYYYTSLATSHYNGHNTFATDVVNSVPTIMMEMLATTDPGTLELLPALPRDLKKGTISGTRGKSRFTINNLTWDTDARTVKVTLTSDIDQNLTLIQRAGIATITSPDITVQSSPLGDIARVLPLKQGKAVTLNLTLKGATSRANLALGKTARASSESNADQTAAKAFDGDPASRWSASESADNWLQVDLGATYNLNEVDLRWEASYAKRYKLQVSADGTTWRDIYTQSASTGGTEKVTVSASGRYVRMQGLEKSGQWGYSLYEMEVYGTA